MRPIKLEIEGLQSFEKRQVIDFKRLTEQGLFGIFGKTGSGKSTILDAITLALYGNIVRIDGSKDDRLINLLNINSNRMEVLYRFSIESVIYEIYRKFSKKRAGDGLTQRCSMSKNGRVIADKTREITEKIDNLIGLNMEDFTRSVVLPQGKFSEFLKLKGVEKRKMLERIFGLEEYGKKFTDRLNGRKNKKGDEVKALENQIMGKGRIEPQEIDIKKEELKSLNIEKEKFDRDNREFQREYREKEEIKKLCDELEENKKIQMELDEKKEGIERLRVGIYRAKQANDINKLYRKIRDTSKDIEKSRDKKIKNEKKLKELRENRDKLNESKNEYLKKEKEYERLGRELEVSLKEIEELNRLLKLKENIESKKIDIDEKRGNIKRERSNITTIKQNLKEEENRLDRVNKELRDLNTQSKEEITELKIDIERLNSKIKEVEELEKGIDRDRENLKIEKGKQEKLKIEIEEIKTFIEKEKSKIRSNLAYILAKELTDGENCPVCGSKEHPNLAKPSGGGDEEYLKRLEGKLDKLNSKYYKLNPQKIEHELQEKIKKLNGNSSIELKNRLTLKRHKVEEIERSNKILEDRRTELEKKRNIFEKNRIELIRDLKNIQNNIQNYNREKDKLKLDLQNLKQRLEEFDSGLIKNGIEELKQKRDFLVKNENESKRYKELEKKFRRDREDITLRVSEKESSISNIKIELSSVQTTLQLLNKNLDEDKRVLEEAIKNSSFKELKEALDSVIHQEKIEEYEKKIESFNKEYNENKRRIENIKAKLDGRTVTVEEWKTIQQSKEEQRKKEKELTENIAILRRDIDNMEKRFKEIEKLLEKKKVQEYEYHLLEELSKLFRGNAFVEYLAIGKLKNITKHASKRLKKITGNRYGIAVGESTEFLIVDNFNGGVKRRSATLSGGETFLVSLSLALALSNQIQLKGKSNLEFFFLDEGFGTLDKEILDRVISSLETLQSDEKLKVGIITHVEELKGRVPRKLEVIEPISGVRGSLVKF